jgi:hypothetical protein
MDSRKDKRSEKSASRLQALSAQSNLPFDPIHPSASQLTHMTPSRWPSRAFRPTFWVCSLALLVVGLLAPATVSAGHCGQFNLANARFEQDIHLLLSSAGSATDAERGLAMPIPPPAPCKGASCSTPPAVPTSPAVTPTSLEEHWPCHFAPLAMPPLCFDLLAPDEVECQPTRHGLSVFHPPRHPAPSA